MKNDSFVNEWLAFAESDFELAKKGKVSKKIRYDNLCFHAQQAVEKAIKAVLLFHNIDFPKTHDIDYLFKLLEKGEIPIPQILRPANELTKYAVTTRYPDDFYEIDKKEYKLAVALASKVLQWAKSIIDKKPNQLF